MFVLPRTRPSLNGSFPTSDDITPDEAARFFYKRVNLAKEGLHP